VEEKNCIQNVLLESREKMTISGVSDVLSFDDQIVIVETDLGLLTIKGENLKINKLNIDTSDFILNGKISSLAYSDGSFEGGKNSNILSKIFK
jgi:sporulation protein YabP